MVPNAKLVINIFRKRNSPSQETQFLYLFDQNELFLQFRGILTFHMEKNHFSTQLICFATKNMINSIKVVNLHVKKVNLALIINLFQVIKYRHLKFDLFACRVIHALVPFTHLSPHHLGIFFDKETCQRMRTTKISIFLFIKKSSTACSRNFQGRFLKIELLMRMQKCETSTSYR